MLKYIMHIQSGYKGLDMQNSTCSYSSYFSLQHRNGELEAEGDLWGAYVLKSLLRKAI